MKSKRRINPDTLALLKHIFTGVLVLAGVAILITAIWYGTRVQALTITSVRVSGGETIEHSQIEIKAHQVLEGTYLGLIPRQFAWFYPESDIHSIIDDIERVHDVSVSRISGTEIAVTFDEYIPKALWCMSVESGDCLFLDDAGYAFGHAPKLSGGSFLRFVKSNQPATLHETISSIASYDTLLLLVDILAQQNWFVSHIEVDQVGDAFIQIVGGGELKVTLSQTAEETAENLFVVLSSDDFSHIAPGNFKYIDLRYGNKVFVNEELAVPEEETTSSTVFIES